MSLLHRSLVLCSLFLIVDIVIRLGRSSECDVSSTTDQQRNEDIRTRNQQQDLLEQNLKTLQGLIESHHKSEKEIKERLNENFLRLHNLLKEKQLAHPPVTYNTSEMPPPVGSPTPVPWDLEAKGFKFRKYKFLKPTIERVEAHESSYPTTLRLDSSLNPRRSFESRFYLKLFTSDYLSRSVEVKTVPDNSIRWNSSLYVPSQSKRCVSLFGHLTLRDTQYGTSTKDLTEDLKQCVGHFSGEIDMVAEKKWDTRAIAYSVGVLEHPLGNVIHGGVSPPRLMAQSWALLEAAGPAYVRKVQKSRRELIEALEGHAGSKAQAFFRVVEKARMQLYQGDMGGETLTIVELGSGNGNLLFSMCPPHPSVQCFGTDTSKKMIQYGSAYFPWIDLRQGVGAAHVGTGSSDLSISHGVAFYLDAQQLCAHVAEGIRVLRPGGVFVMAGLGPHAAHYPTFSSFFFGSGAPLIITNSSRRQTANLLPYCGKLGEQLLESIEFDMNTSFSIYGPNSTAEYGTNEAWFVPVLKRNSHHFCDNVSKISDAFANENITTLLCPTEGNSSSSSNEMKEHGNSAHRVTLYAASGVDSPPDHSIPQVHPHFPNLTYLELLKQYFSLYDWYSHAIFKVLDSKNVPFWFVSPQDQVGQIDW